MKRYLFLLAFFLNLSFGLQAKKNDQTLVFAHRGFSGKFTENSLQAFQQAVNLGVDGVELDVWVCKTGELVVFHDRELARVTNGKGKIIDQTFDELRALKLTNGQKIPTLLEVLTQINRQCIVNIELKGPGTAIPTANVLKDFISKYGWQNQDFIITSFNHPELQKFHKVMPKIPFGPLQEGLLLNAVHYAHKMGAGYLSLNFEYVNAKLIRHAHRLGLKVLVYTVNDKLEITAMKKLGVDGIISNFPDLF